MPKRKILNHPLQSILDCVNKKTKIVFLANPNNPTGTYLNKFEMLELRKN